MKTCLATCCCCIIFFSCAGLKPASNTQQILEGYIYSLAGNQMPGPGRPLSRGRGVSREIYIYAPSTIAQTTGSSPLFTQVNTHLIAQTRSDTTGHYALKLPVGKYSVFIKEQGNLFAAESDGAGILNPVEITADAAVRRDFIINVHAAY